MSVVSCCCALVLTGLVIWRELRPARGNVPADRILPGWDSLVAAGHHMGPDSGVTILVFSDFECPACRQFEENALLPVMREFAGVVDLAVRHFPLSYHRFAVPAAEASECAGRVGRFFEMYHALYRGQDSLGLKPFADIAREAGVTDLDRFESCRASHEGAGRIASDLAAAKALGLSGTPAVAVEGLLLGAVPDSTRLHDLVREHLAPGAPGYPMP
jgi:protein-disulfide isomerase